MTVQHDPFANLDRLRYVPGALPMSPAATEPPAPAKPARIKGEFLKGPIPLSWLSVAAGLRGKAPLAVALAIRFEAGRRRSDVVKLTTAVLARFAVNRKAKYSALAALEAAGLIRVQRRLRKNPVVTILAPAGTGETNPLPPFWRNMIDERSTTSPNAIRALTWTQLVELEPELDALLSEAVVAGFLCRDGWDVEREWNTFKNRLADLVGFHGRRCRHPVLGSYEAYRLAYTTLNDALAGDPPAGD